MRRVLLHEIPNQPKLIASMLRYFLIPVLLLAACLAAAPAYAGCSSPTGNKADQIYNQASHTWQFCNGTNWIPFSGVVASGGGSGCANPAGNEADQIYNQASHTWQFCNGTSWISASVGTVTGGGGGGCSNPSGNEADRIYNADYKTLQFCNGTSWVAIGPLYTGPGDLVGGTTAWFGLRGYSFAVATTGTQKAINIRRASDNSTEDILILKGGDLDTATASTFCASTTCYVTKWYDQTGNGNDVAQGTNAKQPTLTFSCINSLPCLTYSGSQNLYATIPNSTSALSFAAVAERTAAFASENEIISYYAGGGPELFFKSSGSSLGTFNGGNLTLNSVSNSAWHAVQATLASSGTVYLYADGTGTSGSGNTITGASVVGIGAQSSGTSNSLNGNITEAGIWNGAMFAKPQISSLCHNQYLYWGTSTAC